jgi:aminotransferase
VSAVRGFDTAPPAGVARNVCGMQISAIKQMAMLAAQVPDVASLAWGLPSFRTPESIRAAVKAALDGDPDLGKYALPDGVPELRRLAAQRHLALTGRDVDADEHVLVTAGFASHVQQIRLCGGTPVPWPLDEDDGWSLDLDALPGLVGARTKAMILVSPSNPTGHIFAEASLRRVGEIARERGLRILLDDPYSEFCYENHDRCFNLASVPELADTLVYLYTFSKAHAMSGWRMGYAVMPGDLKRQVLKVHDATLICAPRPSQAAAIAALAGEQQHVREFEAILARRRELICQRLDRLPHVFGYVRPQGAYYVFPRIRVGHADSIAFAMRLLDEARVSVTPGVAFGPHGEHHLRMAFCVDEATIETAFDRIERLFPL